MKQAEHSKWPLREKYLFTGEKKNMQRRILQKERTSRWYTIRFIRVQELA